nr:Os06g0549950 [Ipomoea batatas]
MRVKIPVIGVGFSGIVGNIGSQVSVKLPNPGEMLLSPDLADFIPSSGFQHPLENLGGKGAFGIVGLDLEAPLFEIEGAGFGNVEYRDGFRHGNQFQFPGEYDAEASAAAAPDSPEEILPHGFPVQDSPVNIHDSGVNHVRGSGLDPRRLLPNVNLDRPEFDQVQNGKGEGGNKGNALVIVAAASGPELDVILSGANECSSDVGFP